MPKLTFVTWFFYSTVLCLLIFAVATFTGAARDPVVTSIHEQQHLSDSERDLIKGELDFLHQQLVVRDGLIELQNTVVILQNARVAQYREAILMLGIDPDELVSHLGDQRAQATPEPEPEDGAVLPIPDSPALPIFDSTKSL